MRTAISPMGAGDMAKDYIIDYGQSADKTQWWRKWKSGFIEQGGFKQNFGGNIIFLIPFTNIDYTAICGHNGIGAKGEGVINCFNKTLTSMSYGVSLSAVEMSNASWIVYGY